MLIQVLVSQIFHNFQAYSNQLIDELLLDLALSVKSRGVFYQNSDHLRSKVSRIEFLAVTKQSLQEVARLVAWCVRRQAGVP